MSDRFTPDWRRVRPAVRSLRRALVDAEHILIEAFSMVSNPSLRVQSVGDVEKGLEFVVGTGQTPWVLYDTVAEVIERVQEPTKERIEQTVRIDTECENESLRVTRDGRWQVAWIVDPAADDVDDREIALDWYVPPNRDEAPVVPIPIIDYVAACVLLLRDNLVLPAAASLLIALESALWEALSAIGISRHRERIKYAPAKWQLKRVKDRLVVTIEDATRNLEELDDVTGEPPVFELAARRTKWGLKLEADELLMDFFASDQIEERKEVTQDGLSVAIERARKARREGREELACMDVFPEFLDPTIVSLRNNLVHLPPQGDLPRPIPVPLAGELTTVDDLRSSPGLVRTLLPWIVGLINVVYASQLESKDAEPSE